MDERANPAFLVQRATALLSGPIGCDAVLGDAHHFESSLSRLRSALEPEELRRYQGARGGRRPSGGLGAHSVPAGISEREVVRELAICAAPREHPTACPPRRRRQPAGTEWSTEPTARPASAPRWGVRVRARCAAGTESFRSGARRQARRRIRSVLRAAQSRAGRGTQGWLARPPTQTQSARSRGPRGPRRPNGAVRSRWRARPPTARRDEQCAGSRVTRDVDTVGGAGGEPAEVQCVVRRTPRSPASWAALASRSTFRSTSSRGMLALRKITPDELRLRTPSQSAVSRPGHLRMGQGFLPFDAAGNGLSARPWRTKRSSTTVAIPVKHLSSDVVALPQIAGPAGFPCCGRGASRRSVGPARPRRI